jgi:hypothetical protein
VAPAPDTPVSAGLTEADRAFIIDVGAVLLASACANAGHPFAADAQRSLTDARACLLGLMSMMTGEGEAASERERRMVTEAEPTPFDKLELLLARHIHTPDQWAAERLRIFAALGELSEEEGERRRGRS